MSCRQRWSSSTSGDQERNPPCLCSVKKGKKSSIFKSRQLRQVSQSHLRQGHLRHGQPRHDHPRHDHRRHDHLRKKSERRKQKDNARAAKATPAVPAGPPAPPAVIPHVFTSPARQLLQAILPAPSLHSRLLPARTPTQQSSQDPERGGKCGSRPS